MLTPEENAFYELAVLYASDIGREVSYPLLEYAVITCCIRHALKGVSGAFLEESNEELSMAQNITFNLEPNGKN